jgi:hypothetical protein
MNSNVETIQIRDEFAPAGSVDFHLWQDEAGKWYSCRSGTYRGLYSESDDLGPYGSRQEALEAQRDDFEGAEHSAKNHEILE